MSVDTFFAFVVGLLFGSFGNVVILRVPQKLSVVRPRSRCPKCRAPIAWYDNFPVLSWLALGAKCRACRAPIHWRYPLTELVTGLVFAGVFARYGYSWLTLEYLIFSWTLIVCSGIDFDHMILPDIFTLSGIVIGLAGAALNPEREFWPALWGVLIGGGFLYLVAWAYLFWRKEEGMGGGDIKLLAWIGAVLGWPAVPFVVLVSSVVGSLVGLSLVVRSRSGLKAEIPFGPYLAGAALAYILGADGLGHWYVSLFLPASTSVN